MKLFTENEIIFGRNPVFEYIKQVRNNAGIMLLVSETAHGKIINDIRNLAKSKNIKTEACGRREMLKLVPSSRHQGVILKITQHEKSEEISVNEFLEKTGRDNGIIVLLDQIEDPYNLGSIIRTTEALGGNGVLVTGSHSAQLTSSARKAAAGATAYLPVFTISNAANTIDLAKKYGFWIIGTSGAGGEDVRKLREMKPGIVIIGNENKGMRRLTQEKCDYIFRIPLKGNISSLNASVAAGIVLYEVLKEY